VQIDRDVWIDAFRVPARMAAWLGALLVLMLLAFAALAQTTPPRWVFEPPPPQANVNRDYQDVATLTLKVGETHELCWFNPNTKRVGTRDVEDTGLQLAHRRYRVEGGPREVSDVLQFADWKPELDAAGAPVARKYCASVQGPARAGHWIYEAQMCRFPYVSDAESCSQWVASVARFGVADGAGEVDGKPRGWWIYAVAAEDVPPLPGLCRVAPNTIAIFITRPAYGLKPDGTLDKTRIVGRVPVGTSCDCSQAVDDHNSVAGQRDSAGKPLPAGTYALCTRPTV
jgi:hypothetical protein